jgi:lambda repressor-like predicted transcriptional regulator
MELAKATIIARMREKNADMAGTAEAIGLDANLLKLYLVNDSYPVPTRIMKKLAEFLGV